MNATELAALQSRWNSEDGKLILKRLFAEKIELEDIEAGNEAVKHVFDVADLRAVNFSGKDLSHKFLLFELDLSYSDFSRSKIRGSFQDSTVRGCSFNSAEILSCYFVGADLSESTFKGAVINNADFGSTNLQSVSFENAKLINIGFQNVDLTSVNFDGAQFERIKCWNTKLLKTPDLYEKISQSEAILNADRIIWVEPVPS